MRLATLSLAFALGGCAWIAPEPRLSEETVDGLRRVENARFGAVYLKPDAGLGAYDQVRLEPVTISFKRPPRASRGEYPLGEYEKDVRELFEATFREELARSPSLRVVERSGPGVLRLRPAIVDLTLTAPPEGSGRSHVLVQQSADLTLLAELRDSESGEILARVADRRIARRGAGGAYESTALNNRAALQQVFRHWATRMRDGLDRARQLGS